MRILVADDSDIVRRAIIALLSKQSDLEVCGEAKDRTESLRKTRELRPDVVLIDVNMPGGGLETARLVHNEIPSTRIIMISQNDPDVLMTALQDSGADAYVDKSQIATDLIAIIRKFGKDEASSDLSAA
jgi:DNA-binding NarL/FixJ family response regulator